MKDWTAIEVQYAFFQWLEQRGRTLILPGFTPYFWHECDLFSITQALYFHEIEVKISKSDFYADKNKKVKHSALDGGQNAYRSLLPRTFYYACPLGIISPVDIPRYAGLIYVSSEEPDRANNWTGYRIEEIKKAPVVAGSMKMTPEQVFKITNAVWWKFARTWKKMAKAQIE